MRTSCTRNRPSRLCVPRRVGIGELTRMRLDQAAQEKYERDLREQTAREAQARTEEEIARIERWATSGSSGCWVSH